MDQLAEPLFIESTDPSANDSVAEHVLCSTCQSMIRKSKVLQLETEEECRDRGQRRPDVIRETMTHLSLANMEKSAAEGCHLCTIIAWQWRKFDPSKVQLPREPWDPNLPMMDKVEVTIIGEPIAREGFTPSLATLMIDASGQKYFKAQASLRIYKKAGTMIQIGKGGGREVDVKEVYRDGKPPLTTASDASLDLAKFWLETCLQEHTQCHKAQQSGRKDLPSRLLFLGAAGKVRIVLPKRSWSPPYITLSHCWGGTSHILRLTSDTKDDLVRGISVDTLPKTFRDAIRITSRLGYRYLWIDSLCIMQDSTEDWARESRIMGQIYRNSVCTIAATASKNSLQGCFVRRNPLPRRDCRLVELETHTVYCKGDRYDPSTIRPLESRGWVFQEDLLSPRTLHFADLGIEWGCLQKTGKDFDNWEQEVDDHGPNAYIWEVETLKADFNRLCQDFARIQSIHDDHYPSFHSRWWQLINKYTNLSLTFGSDKLPAVSGITQALQSYNNLESTAGHWRQLLPHDLLWISGNSQYKKHECTRTKKYRAPTWSWVSIDGPVSFMFIPSAHHQFGRDQVQYSTNRQVLSALVDVVDTPVIPNGRDRGILTLDVPLYRCKWGIMRPRRPFKTGGGGVWWYSDDHTTKLWGKEVWLMLILRTKRTYDHPCDIPSDSESMERLEKHVKLVTDEGIVGVPRNPFHRDFSFERVGAFSQHYWEDERQKSFVLFRQDGSIRERVTIH